MMRNRLLVTAVAALATGCSSWRPDQMPQVATGFTAHLLCDDVFITGADPDTAFAERVAPQPGMGLVTWAMRRQLDPVRQEVTVSLGGAYTSRARRTEGRGCVAIAGDGEAPPAVELPAWSPPADPAGAAPVAAAEPRLHAALERALAETEPGAPHRTKAVVVLHEGRIVGERYAPGYGVETPVLGFSVSKTMTSALIGILVRQGRLALDAPAPVPEWRDPADARHAITLAHLLRQNPGLDLPQDNSGADISARIMYTAHDKAGASAQAPLAVPPGTRWAYSDTNFMLLSRVLRDAVGGTPADVLRFARQELFAPLGLRHVQMDFDASGTPIGSSHFLASARDWARLGQLFLDDGLAGGRRVLPEGWVRWSATPTLDTGYGAGLWTNRLPGNVPGWGVPWGLPGAPADAFFARGFMGQFVVVVPSAKLVVVRLAVSPQRGDDIAETDRIVREILAAMR